MEMLFISSVISVVGALIAILTGKSEMTSKYLGCIAGIGAAVVAIIAGCQGIFGGLPLTATFTTPFAFANFTILLNPLAGLLLVVINVLALLAWIYGFSYFDEYKGKGMGSIGFFMNLFIVSMNMVLTVDNAFWFLVFFELMSLSSYFLVIIEQKKQSIRGGFLYLIMAHIGFLMIMISFLIMGGITESLDFSAFRQHDFGPVIASLAFMLAFFGFGCKAGMFPFHSWLPQAHPAAPSNVSALMSGGMIKIGVFGFVKVGLDLLQGSEVQLWWGIVILVIGAFSSVLGVAYALAEHDIKKLLAYHSVENIGIILLGVGIGFMGVATKNNVLAALGLMAGFYHLVNHAMFKGLLFLGAGSVLYATETRNMQILGGLGRVMPITGMCFLLGSLAISAIPPLNGFVSEWFTYQSLIITAMEGDALIKAFATFGAVALAITGALAVTCFVKCYGVTFLGRPRSECAANAKEVPAPMTIAMVVLAIVCIILGIGSPLVAPVIQQIATATLDQSAIQVATGISAAVPSLNGASDTFRAYVSTPLVAVLLISFTLFVVGAKMFFSKSKVSCDRDPWACGYKVENGMAITAGTVGAEVQHFLKPIYSARKAIVATSGNFANFFNATVHGAEKAETVGDKYIVDAVAAFISWIGRQAQKIEHGNFRIYIIYIVAVLVLFLALAVGLK